MPQKISIIVPVYNVKDELPRAVQSVRAQDYENWELVLVDDGSTDGSSLICDRLLTEDSRIKVIHQRNAGVVVARKNGLDISSGDWILFLDGDDELSPGILNCLAVTQQQQNADILRFGFVMVRSSGAQHDYLPVDVPSNKVAELMPSVQDTLLELTGTCIGDKIYRRSVAVAAFKDVGDLSIKHSEDGLFALVALLNAATFSVLPVVGYRYYLRPGSAVHRFNVDLAREKDVFIERALDLVRKSPYASEALLGRMRVFHSYEALGFLYSCVLRWSGSREQIVSLLTSARASRFIQDAKPCLTSWSRRIKLFLICHPTCMLIYRFMFRMRRRGICE